MADQSHRRPPPPHPDYVVLATSAAQRKALMARDGGRCYKCGVVTKVWNAEHTMPLWLVDRASWPQCLKYWTIENLQTMGVDCGCHPAKTAQEAAARAKIKRIQSKAIPKIAVIRPSRVKWLGRKPRAKTFKPRKAKRIDRL